VGHDLDGAIDPAMVDPNGRVPWVRRPTGCDLRRVRRPGPGTAAIRGDQRSPSVSLFAGISLAAIPCGSVPLRDGSPRCSPLASTQVSAPPPRFRRVPALLAIDRPLCCSGTAGSGSRSSGLGVATCARGALVRPSEPLVSLEKRSKCGDGEEETRSRDVAGPLPRSCRATAIPGVQAQGGR
jgi:hypothetical protein